jgi:hypothetical protein
MDLYFKNSTFALSEKVCPDVWSEDWRVEKCHYANTTHKNNLTALVCGKTDVKKTGWTCGINSPGQHMTQPDGIYVVYMITHRMAQSKKCLP